MALWLWQERARVVQCAGTASTIICLCRLAMLLRTWVTQIYWPTPFKADLLLQLERLGMSAGIALCHFACFPGILHASDAWFTSMITLVALTCPLTCWRAETWHGPDPGRPCSLTLHGASTHTGPVCVRHTYLYTIAAKPDVTCQKCTTMGVREGEMYPICTQLSERNSLPDLPRPAARPSSCLDLFQHGPAVSTCLWLCSWVLLTLGGPRQR